MNAARALALSAAALLALPACAAEDDPVLTAPTSPAAPSSAPTGSGATPGPAGTTLTALVGTRESPEAFEISLTDSAGAAVTTLPAGTYTIQVTDESRIHNFALRGEGVRMATDVNGKESPTWTVDLKPGDYTYICDPHPRMSGSFTVT